MKFERHAKIAKILVINALLLTSSATLSIIVEFSTSPLSSMVATATCDAQALKI